MKAELWMQSPYSDSAALPRRTFYNYRNAIEELFNINIECNSATYEYYIDSGDSHQESVTDWLLNSAAMSNVLSNVSDISDSIFLEDVPSAPALPRRSSRPCVRGIRYGSPTGPTHESTLRAMWLSNHTF